MSERRWPDSVTRERDAVVNGEMNLLVTFLMALFVIGPTLGLISLTLPHAGDANDLGIIAVVAAAYVIAALIAVWRRRFPQWAFEVVAALGSVLISASIYFSGTNTTTGAFFYLWVVLGSAYFFPRSRVAAQLVVVAIGYAVALALKPEVPGMVQAWIVAVGTLSVAAGLFVITREHVARLVARLAEAADTDPLTELLNRRGFGRHLELELDRAERFETEVSLIIGDLDHFKTVNDRFGHQTGDAVLVEVGNVLRRHARRIDCVARIGGEEFALVIPNSDAGGAYVTAERLRHRVRDALESRHPDVTISFGIASFPNDGESVERLLRSADKSLYAAKTLGRDRTVIYSREVVGALASGPAGELVGPSNLSTLLILAEALDLRDPRTSRHSETVGRYAEGMARELGFSDERTERIRLAGVLHDIGKIGVADSILFKDGPLTDDEWAEIRNHPEIGARLLSGPGFADLRAAILAHHERLDGKGYPFGLGGDAVPLEARIIAVADAFEAMLADRPYRRGRPSDEALAELDRCSGAQFDPRVVEALKAYLRGSHGAEARQAPEAHVDRSR
jgi:diguanylate cyclase (GGDEF)-like protein/putative nucleotidyltransferase with HDIG domain